MQRAEKKRAPRKSEQTERDGEKKRSLNDKKKFTERRDRTARENLTLGRKTNVLPHHTEAPQTGQRSTGGGRKQGGWH